MRSKVTTRGSRHPRASLATWRAWGPVSLQAHRGTLGWEALLKKFGLCTGNSQNNNKWLSINYEFFKISNAENNLPRSQVLGPLAIAPGHHRLILTL